MKIICMIPVRMGSKRLKYKNLRTIDGISLIERAIIKVKKTGVFDEIWVNSEHETFQKIAKENGVNFHKRPEKLADDNSTSEDFVYEFLKKHNCEYIVQIHSIAPLLRVDDIKKFAKYFLSGENDVLLSAVEEQIECMFNGKPVNFSIDKKTNSQKLTPINRITWSMTGWRSQTFLKVYEEGKCATYSGKIGIFTIDRFAGHVIKTQEDLLIAEALINL